MNVKVVVGVVVIIAGLILGAMNFFESNVEYTTFASAERSGKKVQVKGEWVKERESGFKAEKAQFSFFMKDESERIVRVVLDGGKPNNFELATSVVAKGKFEGETFYASDVLTKCPSKYEGDATAVKQTL